MALEDRILAYYDAVYRVGIASPVASQEALYLIKKTREVYKDSKSEETEDNVYATMLSLAAECGIRVPFNSSKMFYSSYMAADTIEGDIPWEAMLGVSGSKMELRIPKVLVREMEEKFTSETESVLIPEAEKFAGSIVEMVNAHKGCKFTLTTQQVFYKNILTELFADNDDVEVILSSMYEYEFISKKFDLIIASPAFGIRDMGENGQFICRELELIAFENLLLHLNISGRLAIILAARVTFAEGKVRELREFVQSMYRLEEISELPNGAFYPYAAVKTYMLTVTTGKTDDVVIKKYSSGSEKPSKIRGIKELVVEDETFVMEEELAEMGSWNLDRIFAMQSDAWEQYQSSSTPKNQLGNVAEIFRGKSISQKDENGSIGVINITNVGDYDIDYDALDHLDMEERKVSNYLLQEGDVLIPARGTALRVSVFEEQVYPCIPSSNLIVIRPDQKMLKSVCLKIFLDSEMGQKLLMGMQQGSTVVNISYKDLGSLEVPTPPMAEQEKMVDQYISERNRYKETIQKAEQRWRDVLDSLQSNL